MNTSSTLAKTGMEKKEVPPLSCKAKSLLLCWEKPGRIYQKYNKLTFKPVTEQNEKKKLYILYYYILRRLNQKTFLLSYFKKPTRAQVHI